jgi:hypothetical protein
VTDRTLSAFEQAELQKELDKIELYLMLMLKRMHGATLNISGPWGGIRSG